MTDPLYVSNEDPVELDGTLDTTNNLQFLHATLSLADYDQTIWAEHQDLSQSTGVIRIKLMDFSGGGANWQITAVHDPGSGSVTWSRGTDHAYCDFGAMTSELSVDITATSDGSPVQTEQRTLGIKTTPLDATFDRRLRT